MKHFLQSTAWAAFQSANNKEVVTDSGKNWSYQAILERGRGNTRLYTPYGPVARDLSSLDAALTSLEAVARSKKADFIRIEPTAHISEAELCTRGFLPVTYQQLQPSHTQIIDLSGDEASLLAAMSQNSRNITRNYHKKGIEIRVSHDASDIELLISLLAGVATRNGITPHSAEYFRTQAATLFPLHAAMLYIATVDGTPAAAAFVYDNGETRYYAHAAADDTFRKLSVGTALLGQIILDAKRDSRAYVDLYGIAPNNDPKHPWHGFTKFKQSFGGSPVTFVGAWDKPLNKVTYYLYRFQQTIRSKLR